jgi:hypothetical protein
MLRTFKKMINLLSKGTRVGWSVEHSNKSGPHLKKVRNAAVRDTVSIVHLPALRDTLSIVHLIPVSYILKGSSQYVYCCVA